jgi:ABC-type transporter Mla subunit MlaD
MVVTIEVDPNIPVSKNGTARIANNDIFGGKAIQLEMGNGPLHRMVIR